MSEHTLRAPNIKSDFLFTWIFRHLKPSEPIKLCEIPESLSLDSSLKSLKKIWSIEQRKKNPSFGRALSVLFWPEFFFNSCLLLIGNSQKCFIAIMVKELIDELESSSEIGTKTSLLAVGIILSALFMSTTKSNSEFRTLLLSSRIRCLTTLMLSDKIMKIHNKELNDGNILNIFGADFELLESIVNIPILFTTPLLILNAALILNYFFGSSGLVGIGVSICHIPIIFILALVSGKFRRKCALLGDARVKLVSNFIEGIKIFKLYAWELIFLERIKKIRHEEIKERYKLAVNTTLMIAIAVGGSILIIFTTFYVHLKWVGEPMTIGEKYMLIIIYLSNHLQIVHLNTIAILMTILIKGVFRRITQVMVLDEFRDVEKDSNSKYAVSLIGASFSHSKKTPKIYMLTEENLNTENSSKCILNNINFSLKSGQLLIVIGSVGSGKSSLLQAIQHELYLVDGHLDINGTICYVSEVPWIISGTLRDNILMGSDYDHDKYTKILSSCSLIEDIELLINKDQTWIGERGITLSGGQKARINLARALYRNFNILLMDDPLSAVDPKVCNHIFNECILYCKSMGKTVILVTHQLQFLNQADKILVLEKGASIFFGKPKKLKYHKDIVQQIKTEKNYMEEGDDFKPDYSQETGEETEEMMEKLEFKSVLKYFYGGFGNWFFIIVGLLLIACMHVAFQGSIYWSSHRNDLDNKSEDYFLNGLGYWTISLYSSLLISLLYLTNFYTRCNHKLHDVSITKIASVPSVFFDKNPPGRIINRFSKDISNCDGLLHFYLTDSGNVVGMVLSSIIVLLIIVPLVLVSLPLYLIAQFFLLYKLSSKISKLRKKENLSKAPIMSLISSMLEGVITIRSQKLQSKFYSDMTTRVNYYYQCFITYQSYLRFCQLYTDLAGLIIVIVNLIVLIQTRDSISIGLLAYSLSASMNIVSISSSASKDIIELSTYLMSVQNLLEYQKLETEKLESDEEFRVSQGKIQFDNLSFKYQPHLPRAIKHLSLLINPREKIGIVGRTGSGKSSIFNALCRLADPLSGTIYIDDQDYLSSGLHNLRKQISVIPQSAILFSTTLKDNLDPFGLHSEDKINKVLNLVGLEKFANTGLDSKIGFEGIKLSAGEKQLVCIARAILINNKIVLLDEATSNIDVRTDQLIQKTIKSEFNNSTMIVIAHRILTAADSDKIAVMDKGKCVEFGKPVDLFLTPNSIFNTLALNAGLTLAHFQ